MAVTRGFTGRRRGEGEAQDRVPPGQFATSDFPVLTAGPTPQTAVADWSLALQHGGKLLGKWSWDAFNALPQTEVTVDIHCVTKWSKLDTRWRGVTFDDLMGAAGIEKPPTKFVIAHCDGGYTTNLPVADLSSGKAMIATHYDGLPYQRPTGVRHPCSCRTSTSGRAPNGCAACLSRTPTVPASGSRSATTSTAIRGGSSGTRAIHD